MITNNKTIITSSNSELDIATIVDSEGNPRLAVESVIKTADLNNAHVAVYDEQNFNAYMNVSPIGQAKVAELTRLIGDTPEMSTLDTSFWSVVNTGSGTTTQTGGVIRVRTNTTSGSASRCTSFRKARFISGFPNVYSGGVRLSDTGIANNVRRWGIGDSSGNDGLFFQLQGATFGILQIKDGVSTFTTTLNGTTPYKNITYPIVDTNFHLYEIIFNSQGAWFYQDRVLIHTLTLPTDAPCSSMSLPIRHENINAIGATSDASLYFRSAAILRFGKETSRPTYSRFNHSQIVNGAVTRTLRVGAGTFQALAINSRAGAGGTATFYDNASASGTIMAIVEITVTTVSLPYNIEFDNGLTVVMTGNNFDCTVIYD